MVDQTRRPREAEGGIYAHLLLVLLTGLLLVLPVALLLARRLIVGFLKQHEEGWGPDQERLRRVDLFVNAPKLHFPLGSLFRSAWVTPIANPWLLLFPVAVVILLVPHAWVRCPPTLLIAGGVAWLVLALAGVHERLNAALSVVEHTFFRGMLWLVSLAVIGLAACRFFEFSYVSILLEAATFTTLAYFLVCVYLSFWLYEYWIGTILARNLLRLLNAADGRPAADRVPYPYEGKPQTEIAVDGRVLQVHGTRFVAVGKFPLIDPVNEGWEFYDRVPLFEALVRRESPPAVDPTAAPQPLPTERVETRYGLPNLRQRVRFYFLALDTLLVAFLGVTWWCFSKAETVPELEATPAGAGSYSLHAQLFPEKAPPGEPRRVVLVAASGGGTRAALYTTSVLRGLSDIDALKDVKLYSGVSGGSAAIAHLLMHHEPLVVQKDQGAWDRLEEAMCQPYIDDVLRGSLEVRVAGGARTGTLLAESFARHMGYDNNSPTHHLGTTDAGVIFNTTLAAIAPKGDGREDPASAGARLILTNLGWGGDAGNPFPKEGFAGAKGEFLRYEIIRDPGAPLTTAAALSANFPPVFSNAAIDLTKDKDASGKKEILKRYWVTDGGASDNRGAVSLLYALKGALEHERDRRKAAGKGKQTNPPPPLHIVIADASGLALDFEQDRGIGSAAGAAEKYASQLMVELLRQIHGLYLELEGDPCAFRVHYLPMPSIFRDRGGIPTHWMLPARVTLQKDDDERDTLTIDGELARTLVMELHNDNGLQRLLEYRPKEAETIQKAWLWITEAEKNSEAKHSQAWKRLKEKVQEDNR